KVLEHEYGKGQMRKFLQEALNSYLSGRSYESKKEKPLMYNENQQYIHYNKGSLIFYALSDYLGEEKLNKILSNYIDKVAFQEPPFTTAGELVEEIKKQTPDSLQYMVKDMCEDITLYDNYIEEVSAEKLENGKYEVDIKAIVSKYKSGEQGEKTFALNGDSLVYTNKREKEVKSLPLEDYIEVGIFSSAEDRNSKKEEEILYLEKLKFTEIENDFKIIVDKKPTVVGIDPYNKLIDTKSYDNRKKVKN